jgi:redox-sensing transcriptional repressor
MTEMGERVFEKISEKTVGRLSLYRRMLTKLEPKPDYVYSHDIAALSGVTSAQVRRDLMVVGQAGSPNRGYRTEALVRSIGEFLDDPRGQKVALVGAGHLGQAILAYSGGRRPKLAIVAAFDSDPEKANQSIHGCKCYPIEQLIEVVRREKIRVGIITVPADSAQKIADALIEGGVKGILSFAPVSLRVPPHVYVDDIDMIMALEKVSYFARKMGELQNAATTGKGTTS